MARLATIKAYLKEHPEEAAELNAQLRAIIKEALNYYAAVRAFKEGDTEMLRLWVTRRMNGVKPDARLETILETSYLPEGGNIPFPFVCRLLTHHEGRLNTYDQQAWYLDHAEAVYRRLHKNPDHDLMRSLRGYEKPYEALRHSVAGAVFLAEAEGFWGGADGDTLDSFMLGRVEAIIVEDNRLLKQTRKQHKDEHGDSKDQIVSLDALPTDTTDLWEGPQEAAAYDGVEDADALQNAISRAGLTPAELEVVNLFLSGWTAKDIAEARGTTRNTVDGHFRNIHLKLAAVG